MLVGNWRQESLPFGNRWGGARFGAGRPRNPGRANVAHRARSPHRKDWPVLVTLRTRFRTLRCEFVYPTVRGVIASVNRPRSRGRGRVGDSRSADQEEGAFFRVCQFSVQGDHIHLLVEASSALTLERGIRGLSIRLAKRVNQLVFQTGRVMSDRYHSLPLKTPRAVRNALIYVLANFRKHGLGAQRRIDPYSSGPYFCGFQEFVGIGVKELAARFVPRALAPPAESPVVSAGTWLLARGWLRHGRVSVWDQPKKQKP